MAALPQCIQAAKELYDLRARYKDASVLITAIYSESMVIAASLSQIQNLLHHDALQSKPQLLETFDRAITGCRVVYGCLDEEVRDLVLRAENENLRFTDRAKFLWKEDTFKELLTQIRGQQSALSLLIQGLQMESIADIRKLVEDNSVTLGQVVKRSRALRQSHPRLKVPESVFSKDIQTEDVTEADSIIQSTEFAFDDEVVNSRAYRKAMALYTSQNKFKVPHVTEKELVDDDSTAFEPTHRALGQKEDCLIPAKTPSSVMRPTLECEQKGPEGASTKSATTGDHQGLLDSLEKDILAYMPRNTSTAPCHNAIHPTAIRASIVQDDKTLTPAPLQTFCEGRRVTATEDFEKIPPLPLRCPSELPLKFNESASTTPKTRSASSEYGVYASDTPSSLSKVSTWSSFTVYESSLPSSTISRKSLRKPLPLAQEVSEGIANLSRIVSSEHESPVAPLLLQSAEIRSIWALFIVAERTFVERMEKFRKMFYDQIIREWPILEKHLEAILVGGQIASLNRQILLQSMEQQTASNENALCDPTRFGAYINQSHKLYQEYCQRMPHAASSLRTTQNLDPKFSPFVKTLGLSVAYSGKGWEDYLELPNLQLQSYEGNLQKLVNTAEALEFPAPCQELQRLKSDLETVIRLRTVTSTLLKDARNRENVRTFEKRVQTLDANLLSDLRLLEPTRRVKNQGGMAIKLKSQGPWRPVRVILLDNYLLWGKVKPPKKGRGERILILDAPIAISDLKIDLPCGSHQFQKATMFDDIPRGSVV